MRRMVATAVTCLGSVRRVCSALVVGVGLCLSPAFGDTPASSVVTQAVPRGQPEPVVYSNKTGWFDVGGFCKVVDVGDLSGINPPVIGIPVFIPGPAPLWETWRTSFPAKYQGQLTSTTCCRPQVNVATICSAASNPQPVSRQYGRLGETDIYTATCEGPDGEYTESLSLTCGGDNGPDGQAAWSVGGDVDSCISGGQTVTGGCSTAGVGGWGTQTVQVFDCLDRLQSSGSQACYSTCVPDGTCGSDCGTSDGVDSCGHSCAGPACAPPAAETAYCIPITYTCGSGSPYNGQSYTDCGGPNGGSCDYSQNPDGTYPAGDFNNTQWKFTTSVCTGCECSEQFGNCIVQSGLGCCSEMGTCFSQQPQPHCN